MSPPRAATPARDAAAERAFAAERGIAGIRLVIIASGTLIYPLLMDKAGTVPWLAYLLLALAWVYGLWVWWREPYRKAPVMMSSYFISATDAAFTTLWLYATGGIASPFYVALYGAIAAIAFRYGARETFVAAGLYSAAYLAMLASLGQVAGHVADIVVRVVYVFFVGGVGAALSRELRHQTLEKAQMRELAELLEAEAQERRRAEERLRRSEALLTEAQEIAHVGSWEWDLATNQVTWSDEMYRLYGHAPRAFQVTFDKAMEQVLPEDAEVIHGNLARLFGEGRAAGPAAPPVEYRVRLPDDSVRLLYGQGRLVAGPDGKPARMVGTVQDITERRRGEEERRAAEGRLRELERLREMDAFKTRFINTAAHELGTPLTPIKVQLSLLEETRGKGLTLEQRKSVRILRRNVDRLVVLVRDVLDAARLQAGRLPVHRQPLDIGSIAEEAVESFEAAAARAGIALELRAEPGLRVAADPTRLAQVLLNLLGNAVKFTPAGGRILVEAARDGASATVRVRDTGIGLRPEDIARLFEPFSQVHDAVQRAPSGTGLGLYICKGIVGVHGGRISAESEGPGRGACFSFTLPLLAEGAAGARAEAVPTPA